MLDVRGGVARRVESAATIASHEFRTVEMSKRIPLEGYCYIQFKEKGYLGYALMLLVWLLDAMRGCNSVGWHGRELCFYPLKYLSTYNILFVISTPPNATSYVHR